MANLTLTTFDWVPEMPRGFVRDLRVRWALEEAALPYRVASVPFGPRDAAHFAHQPFGQVPWLTDDDLSIFESGAILLHLGELSAKLMPTDPRGRSDTVEWVFAALNSVEMPALPWTMFKFTGSDDGSPAVKFVVPKTPAQAHGDGACRPRMAGGVLFRRRHPDVGRAAGRR
ncbi:glutathione S-transferase [Bradyrhizobium japonicum]